MHGILRSLTALLLFSLAFVHAPASAEAKAGGLTLRCQVVPALVTKYLEGHVLHDKPTPELRSRAVDLLSKRLDPSKTLLTRSEYQAVRTRLAKIYRGILGGDCDDVEWIAEAQVEWQEEMLQFADQILEKKGLEIDRSIELELDPDERKRPVNERAQRRLRRKVIHFQLASLVSGGISIEEAKQKVRKRYELAKKRAEELERKDIYTLLLDAYANGLDPHTGYLSQEMLEDFRISMKLSLEGIGAVLTSRDGYTIVREIVPGGAADRHGELQVNDKIIAVAQGEDGDPVDVVDMALRDVVRKIRGERGTKVKLVVLRQEEETRRIEMVITRDKIDIKQQAAKLRWETAERRGEELKLAVIELPSFYGGKGGRYSADDVRKLLGEAKEKGADGVLIDLSRNGGGLLKAAVEVAGLFLVKGAVVGIDTPAGKNVLEDEDAALDYDGPLVVLTSRVSASASEIFAGVMQDYQRAVVVGDDHTFGKGSVQNVVNVPRGLGALKITQGLYYLPGGHSTQSRGVPADIVVPSPFASSEIGEKEQPYSLPPRKIRPFKSASANKQRGGYDEVTRRELRRLERRSKRRLARNQEFKELEKNLRKQEREDGTVRLAELFDSDGDGKDDEPAEGEEEKDGEEEEELSLQAKEATEILADLVVMNR